MPFQFQSRDVIDFGVVFIHDMQDYVLVGFVGLVTVAVPVGCFHMDFHMAGPELVADLDFGFKEVGTRVGVAVARGHDVNRFAFRGFQVLVGQAVLPDVV